MTKGDDEPRARTQKSSRETIRKTQNRESARRGRKKRKQQTEAIMDMLQEQKRAILGMNEKISRMTNAIEEQDKQGGDSNTQQTQDAQRSSASVIKKDQVEKNKVAGDVESKDRNESEAGDPTANDDDLNGIFDNLVSDIDFDTDIR